MLTATHKKTNKKYYLSWATDKTALLVPATYDPCWRSLFPNEIESDPEQAITKLKTVTTLKVDEPEDQYKVGLKRHSVQGAFDDFIWKPEVWTLRADEKATYRLVRIDGVNHAHVVEVLRDVTLPEAADLARTACYPFYDFI